jgi:putative tricarboxylic transport membrane protein
MDGISLGPFVMGVFGISEVFLNIEKSSIKDRTLIVDKVKGLLPTLQDWKDCIMPITRGSIVGFFLGILPGGGAIISSFFSYAIEKRISKHPEKFGRGAIEGVAGPESSNNSATAGGLVPLLTLGIPPNVVMAILLGILIVHDVVPGPKFISQHPGIFWGFIASMYIGNIMLLILNLPLIGLWVKVLRVPYKILFPIILLFCVIGAYGINNSTFDIYTMIVFGVLGYLMRKYEFEGAPMVLAFFLGPMFETSFKLSLLMSDGSFSIFFTRPISAGGMIITFLLLVISAIPIIRRRKEVIGIG